MTGCPSLATSAGAGIAATLRQVDCLSAQSGEGAFGRLFGAGGTFGAVLSAALTIYVALLAISLLTGRSSLSLSALTPRMLGVGLVLTFATSWFAYQTVVWNLLTGAPDQIASLLLGTHGSATTQFADRLDAIFASVTAAAQQAPADTSVPVPGVATAATIFGPANLLWASALLLLLGTVGVLLVARLALTALLALGPIFILLGLFRGTRGLLDGWIRAATLFALTPLFTVLIGGQALAMIAPLARGLGGGSQPPQRLAIMLLLAACVYTALMAIALKVAVTITTGWKPTGRDAQPAAPGEGRATQLHSAGVTSMPAMPAHAAYAGAAPVEGRIGSIVAAVGPRAEQPVAAGAAAMPGRTRSAILPFHTPIPMVPVGGNRLRETVSRPAAARATPARTVIR